MKSTIICLLFLFAIFFAVCGMSKKMSQKAESEKFIMGHANVKNQAMKCAGFFVTSLHGAEWAASGKVTQAVPENLPTKTEVLLREGYKEQ